MKLFNFGVATEANDFTSDEKDQIWIKGQSGQLIELEDDTEDEDD